MLRLLTFIFCTLLAGSAAAQTLYKYRDEQGRWQFTDRQPADLDDVQTTELRRSRYSFDVILEAVQDQGSISIQATNEFHAPVELRLRLSNARNLESEPPKELTAVLPPTSSTAVVTARLKQNGRSGALQYAASYMLGDPAAEHRPDMPYRVPYAIGQSYPVTQAFPGSATHVTPNSQHAVDIAMPEGTGIYAARAGTVVLVSYDSFSGGMNPGQDAPKANLVRILHADGTMAIYAHLQWESVRIKPGDRVDRGEFIARSGNTGFSSGPHLHFAVEKNTGLQLSALPVSFLGASGEPVQPHAREALTAH